MTLIHVYPQHDAKRHEVDGAPCWCRPRFEEEANGVVCVHNESVSVDITDCNVLTYVQVKIH